MSYETVPYTPELKGELSSLWCRNLSDTHLADRVSERMRWLYEDCPEGPTRTRLALAGSRVVGCGSFVPRTLLIEGRPVRAGVLSDFAVDHDHRAAGAAVAIQRALVREREAAGLELLFGWPNSKAAAIFRRVGYASVGEATRFVKPLRLARHVAARLMSGSGSPLVRRVVRVAARPVSLALDGALLADDLACVVPRLARLRGELSDSLDARADELFARVPTLRIAGALSAAYLNWRYAAFPTAKYRFFSVSERRGGALTGLLAFTSLEDGTAAVVDLCTTGAPGALDTLLSWFALEARAAGAEGVTLTAIAGPELGLRLARLRFFPRATGRSLLVHASPERERSVLDPARWFVLDGEIDL